MSIVCTWFLYFMIYSFIGWACETVYCSVGNRKFVNRGFLNGPLCPVYAFGGIAVLLLLKPFSENVFLLFIMGIIITSVLEYITSWLLEKIFHLKLWDYSTYICNINGRVCLQNSLMFGGLVVLLNYYIHPFVVKEVAKIPEVWMYLLVGVLFGILISDLIVTINTVLKLNGKLKELESYLTELKEKNEKYALVLKENIEEKLSSEKFSLKTRIDEIGEKIKALQLKNRFDQRRFVKAFPNMQSKRTPESLKNIKEILLKHKEKNNK